MFDGCCPVAIWSSTVSATTAATGKYFRSAEQNPFSTFSLPPGIRHLQTFRPSSSPEKEAGNEETNAESEHLLLTFDSGVWRFHDGNISVVSSPLSGLLVRSSAITIFYAAKAATVPARALLVMASTTKITTAAES